MTFFFRKYFRCKHRAKNAQHPNIQNKHEKTENFFFDHSDLFRRHAIYGTVTLQKKKKKP